MLVGRIGRAHGLGGHVVVHPETDNPARFVRGARLFDADGSVLEVERSQDRQGSLLVRFVGVADRTAAEALTGTALYIDPVDRRPLEPDEYWPDDLVGLSVHTHDGSSVGTVVGVVEGAAQFRLDIQGATVRFEVPFVAALVPEVDLEGGLIVLADVPGLVPTGD